MSHPVLGTKWSIGGTIDIIIQRDPMSHTTFHGHGVMGRAKTWESLFPSNFLFCKIKGISQMLSTRFWG